ncbi:hypothetical protein [Lysobacter antibioticus]|uniref:hypothetical protein n=1 Tax=Lysobacter antibioticus TaxID=84531 RepID=UPI00126A7595|nr:hypothetical protein [Lysobacter antibioticus]
MRTSPNNSSPYVWLPGQGPNAGALQRLRERAFLPKQAMGEAWFMGQERRMYTALMHEDPQQWPRSELDSALYELSSGPASFGPMHEWSLWFAFLLPRALELVGRFRADAFIDRQLCAALVTATFVHFPDPEQLPAGVRRDLLDTLGRAMFAPSHWSASGLAVNAFCSPMQRLPGLHPGESLYPADAFSASCTLIAKYLEPECIEGWLASALAIEDPYWRAGWVAWLAGAAPMLLDGAYPDALPFHSEHPTAWSNSHLLQAPSALVVTGAPAASFLGSESRHALTAALRRQLNRERLQRWGTRLSEAGAQPPDFEYFLVQYRNAARLVLDRYQLD